MKKSVAALAGLAAFAPAALAAPSHFLKVTPGQTSPGKAVTISGSVDRGCQIGHRGDAATIYSNAFKGATKQSFAGVPAVSAALGHSKTGAFAIKLKLSKNLKTGTYSVGGRCGGGNFGAAKLKVVRAASQRPPGFY